MCGGGGGGRGKEEGRDRRRTLKGKLYDRHHNLWPLAHDSLGKNLDFVHVGNL